MLTSTTHVISYSLHYLYPRFNMQGREAANAGDVVTAKKKINRSLYCNIASIVGAVFGLIGAVVLFLFIFVMIGLLSTQ